MKRSQMKRGTKRMKSRGPVMTPIRKAARNQECTLRFPACNYDIQTTVLCHSNLLEHGKGAGLKAPDTSAAFGCSSCHDLLDGRVKRPVDFSYELMIARFKEAIAQTHRILKRMGLMEEVTHGR
jgi:hypothetical protein